MEQAEQNYKVYWEIQLACVLLLKELAIEVPPNQRLSPFKLTVQLRKIQDQHPATVSELIHCLADLVNLRSLGYEPPHVKGYYK